MLIVKYLHCKRFPFTGIPDNPDLANTYYSQFEEEFEENDKTSDESEEELEEEGTVVGQEDDVADYINHLEGALHLNANGKFKEE